LFFEIYYIKLLELKTLKKEDATKLYSLGRGLNKGTPGSDPLAESNTEVHKKNKRSKINKKSGQ
jgi:hypothetical protein